MPEDTAIWLWCVYLTGVALVCGGISFLASLGHGLLVAGALLILSVCVYFASKGDEVSL